MIRFSTRLWQSAVALAMIACMGASLEAGAWNPLGQAQTAAKKAGDTVRNAGKQATQKANQAVNGAARAGRKTKKAVQKKSQQVGKSAQRAGQQVGNAARNVNNQARYTSKTAAQNAGNAATSARNQVQTTLRKAGQSTNSGVKSALQQAPTQLTRAIKPSLTVTPKPIIPSKMLPSRHPVAKNLTTPTNVIREAKRAGDNVARESKRFGGDVAREAKPYGGSIADAAKGFGGTVSREAKNLGGELAGASHRVQREAGKLPHVTLRAASKPVESLEQLGSDISRETRQAGREASDASKRVQKEVGRPWVRGVRDPWVRFLERGYGAGQDQLDRADRNIEAGIVEGTSKAPEPYTGDQLQSNDADVTVSQSPYGNSVARVDAPNGGTVGFDIPMDMEGKDVRITMWVIVREGEPRIGLAEGQNHMIDSSAEGKTILSTESGLSKAGFSPSEIEAMRKANGGTLPKVREFSIETRIPSDGKGYGGTNSKHDFQAVLQLEPGTKLDVAGGYVQRI